MCKNSIWDLINSTINRRDERDERDVPNDRRDERDVKMAFFLCFFFYVY